MTDKEQIIIDGVDVSGCVQFTQEEEDCCNLGGGCKGWSNCYYKQLAREQECDRYRKALEEIEEVWAKDEDGDYDFVKWQILDIIDEVKREDSV